MNIEELKQQVCERALEAYHTGLFEGTCGNLSVYDRETGRVVITPSCFPYEQYTPADMVVIDLNGDVLEGRHKPSSEWIMHTMVYREKPEVGSVIHTHSPYATSFAVRGVGIPAVLMEMIPTLGGAIPLAPFGMPGTDEVGRRAVEALSGGHGGCLLAYHGVLAVGETLEQALVRAGYVENAAKIYALALSTGPVAPIPDELAEQIRRHYAEASK